MAVKKQPAKPRAQARSEMSPHEIRQRIEIAAYYRAQERGFAPGHELDDWVAAEAEVRRGLQGTA